MANIDYRGDGAVSMPNTRAGRCYTLQARIDSATNNIGSGDVVALFNIPANTFIHSVHTEVETAEGATGTIDIGLYSDFASTPTAIDADGFGDAVSVNATAGTIVDSTALTAIGDTGVAGFVPAYYSGKTVTSASVFAILANHALDAAVFTIQVICFDLTPPVNSATTVYNY